MKHYIYKILIHIFIVAAFVISYIFPPDLSLVFNNFFWSVFLLLICVCFLSVTYTKHEEGHRVELDSMGGAAIGASVAANAIIEPEHSKASLPAILKSSQKFKRRKK